MQETRVPSLCWEDPLEKEMAAHSSILAWEIPWTVVQQAPLSMGFSRLQYWSGVPFPSLGDLLNPGMGLASSALAGRFFITESPINI